MFKMPENHISRSAACNVLAASFVAMILAQAGGSGLASPADSGRVTVKVTIAFKGRSFKVSNNTLVVFQRNWAGKGEDSVELFDWSGGRLASFNPLASVEGAEAMSIWDVAVGSTGLVALAAVFSDSEGRHAASLLQFDTAGRLLHTFNLAPERMIRRLAVDQEENTWALGETSGLEDTALTPAVFKYNKDCKLVGQYIPVAELPPPVQQDPQRGSGPDAIGLTADGVWFWVPERRALVTFLRDGTHVEILDLGTPPWVLPGGVAGHDVEALFNGFSWLSRDTFVAQTTLLALSSSHQDTYTWSKATGKWTGLSQGGYPGALVGTDGGRLVFGHSDSDRREIEFQWVDVPEF
jgi:hypothetical protein